MTLPIEEANALVYARIFMRSLLFKDMTRCVPDRIRKEARSRLKHFPSSYDIRRMVSAVHGEDIASKIVDEDEYWKKLVEVLTKGK